MSFVSYSLKDMASIRRGFCSGLSRMRWRNETPSGGLTEMYVYSPESETVWPDPKLSVFSDVDPRFPLPGFVGPSQDKKDSSKNEKNPSDELLYSFTNKEVQTQTLSSAKDFIQYTKGSESYLCKNIISEFPELPGIRTLKFEFHEAPTLLKSHVQPMFPHINELSPMSVISLSQKTNADMSKWSDATEKEREVLTEHFLEIAKEVCARIKDQGYWADFIHPSFGTPYYAKPKGSLTFYETDEKFRLLGFRIEDLGCCKVLVHKDFGKHVFVGVIFTNAHPSQGVVQDMFQDLKMN
uniref:Methylmalonic aciduria and homocystinuria type D protein, mitochondrial n=1 Tax=Lepeophtheirus salmonis TaxID=72036 RepID=D3PIJ6_LEPSM|nr:Methylmalonic aciduria and homocystinuria type D protein, mitochondrial [Lepeophtheirus salmonis]